MVPDEPQGPLFIDGDHEVPDGSRLERGIMATGYLTVGDGVFCHGDLFGGEGINLGDEVTIEGNLYSHGEITWGDALALSGSVYSKAPRPLEEALKRHDLSNHPEPSMPMLQTALDDSLMLLLEVAWDGHQDGREGYPSSWWGLAWEETTEMVERVLALVDQIHRSGQQPTAWSADDLFEVLLTKGLATVVPISMDRTGQRQASLTVGRPTRRFDATKGSAGWAWPTVSLLNLVGYGAHEGFRLVVNDEERHLEPDADPDTLKVTIELLEEHAPEPPG